VLVRGRLDHKERGETKLVVQEAERFEPDSEEIAAAPAVTRAPAGPFEVEIAEGMYSEGLVDELKAVLEHHKGDTPVRLTVVGAGERRTPLKLGNAYRVRPSGRLQSELDHLLGPASALAA